MNTIMRLNRLIPLIIFLFGFTNINAQSDSVCIDIATKSVEWLNTNNAESLCLRYDKAVAAKLSASTTASIWNQIEAQFGEFVEVDTLVTNTANGNFIVDQVLEFENNYLKYRLSFNANNEIAGIFFTPYRTAKAAAESTKVYKETKCSFVNDEIEFPAILCTPKQQKSKAVVILVHGSGPNDMDETIGPNKIFKQIANKLAKYGIASLRYDKRSFLAQQGNIGKINTDINSIVVSDAVAAAKFMHSIDSLENLPRIIVGHSLGAFMAPKIGLESANVDAIVMLAANARPLEDLIIEQYKYLYAQDGISKEEKKEIKAMKKKVKNVKKLEKYVAKGKVVELPLTNDTAFWLSLNNYKPLKTISNLQMPILIMQGGRDYQVSMDDFRIWHSNVRNSINKDQTFVYYSGLNHLFIKGNTKSYPSEYNKKAEVSENMIRDLSDWIKSIWNNNYSEPKLKRGITHYRKG